MFKFPVFVIGFVIFVANTLPCKYIFGLFILLPTTIADVLLFPKYKLSAVLYESIEFINVFFNLTVVVLPPIVVPPIVVVKVFSPIVNVFDGLSIMGVIIS